MDSATAMEWIRGVGFPVLVAWYVLKHIVMSQSRDMAEHRSELAKIRQLLTRLVERFESHHEESRHSNRGNTPVPITSEKTPRGRFVKRASTDGE